MPTTAASRLPPALAACAALLRRAPMQAFYLAALALAGVSVFTLSQQRISENQALTEENIYTTEVAAGDRRADAAEETAAQEVEEAADAALSAPATLAVAAPDIAPRWLEYRIRRGDTMDKVLKAIKTDEAMRRYLLQQKFKTYRRLRIGKTVYFQQDERGQLRELLYKTSPEYYFSAGRDAAGALWAKEEAPAAVTTRHEKIGVIDSSLFAATDAAGMSDAAAGKLVEVLETQIDFYRDVRKGDTFRVIYDLASDDQGEALAVRQIVAFEYVNHLSARPRRIRGVFFEDGDISGYYTEEGESMRRAFLPAPLKYRRISSRFSHNRLHPVLKRWRPHRGVDYAAPTGTPVRATADGVVSLVDRQRGYGRVVMIKHFNIYTTVYAHLSKFKKGIRRGRRVAQGEVIGYVGQSGLATGPHLHYEFRVRGKHKNPLSTTVPKNLPPLKGETLEKFKHYSAPLFAELSAIAPPPPRS